VRFLGCQHPVLGLVLWKQPTAATSREARLERQEHDLVSK